MGSSTGRPKRDDLAFTAAAVELWDSEAHELGYMARVFAQTALPYRNPGDELPEWIRFNGNAQAGLTLTIQPGPGSYDPDTGSRRAVGYPYGTIPRLLLTWLATEAVRRKERTLPLGESLSDFMGQLGLAVNGGKTGTIGKLRDQSRRLFRARVAVEWRESKDGVERDAFRQLTIADDYDLWTSTKVPDQLALIPSYVELSDKFFREVTEHPVPVSLDALRALRGSPMRLDIYSWLTHRMSYLRRQTTVPWEALWTQFGSDAKTDRGRRQWKADFLEHLARVLVVYPDAKVEELETGLKLRPSPPHVSRKSPMRLDT